MIDPGILHFDHLGAEKIEFEVGRSDFEKWQFFLPDILMLIHPVHFKSFFLLSDDIVGMKYFRKKYFLFPQYHLIRGNKI